jgi:hypothetical protein
VKIPVWLQHLLVALAGTFLSWAASDGIPLLREQPGFGALAAALAAALLGYLTPIIDSYGIGSRPASGADAGERGGV